MPLVTTIERDGELLKLPNGWGGFHVAAMALVAMAEEPKQPAHEKIRDLLATWHRTNGADAAMPIMPGDVFSLMDYGVIGSTVLNDGPYTVKETHRFVDPQDNEVFEIKSGDVLNAGRQ